jgi:hypothetical protein
MEGMLNQMNALKREQHSGGLVSVRLKLPGASKHQSRFAFAVPSP